MINKTINHKLNTFCKIKKATKLTYYLQAKQFSKSGKKTKPKYTRTNYMRDIKKSDKESYLPEVLVC